jgi:3-deoxy-D-manno-octulosonic-acid transferase
MTILLDLVYLLAALVLSPMVVYRALRHNRYRSGWGQRFGFVTRRHPEQKCIWIHGVSVGEVNAAQTVITELNRQCPDYEIVISATTDTGFARAQTLYGRDYAVFYYPLDVSFFIRRAFGSLKPTLCLLMELEVWPNFLKTAQRLATPVVVVNGRISDKSFPSYKKAKRLLSGTFSRVSLVLAQTQTYAERFTHLGCAPDKVLVTGSIKYDTAQICDRIAGADTLAQELQLNEARLWVAGGTGTDEEGIILAAFQELKQQAAFDDLRLAIVPRKPERFDAVAQQIQQTGFSLLRYSQIKGGSREDALDSHAVILGDTMGDLRKFYSLATVAFVGRSLVPVGGSDMMEVAALGKPTLFGPYTFNFTQTVEALLQGQGAIEVADQAQLLEAVKTCLEKPEYAQEIGLRGQAVIRANQGATAQTVGHILHLLKSP